MKKFFFSCCFFILCNVVSGQNDFPKQFFGHWEGEVRWHQPGKKDPQKFKMQLFIGATDTAGQYTWQIIYGENNKDNRPYILKPVDSAKGHWQIDERNGIILDQYWIGNKFSGAFTVGNNTIVDSYWIEKGKLHVEFFTVSAKPISTTGGTSQDVPPVDSYFIKGYQKGVLKKKK